MMTITPSADERLVAKAQAYAQAHNTTLDHLLCDFLEHLTGQVDAERAAEAFAEIARTRPGCSDEGFVFDRGDAHARH